MAVRHFLTGIVTALAVFASAQAMSGTSQQNLFPDHNYSRYALPSVGTSQADVLNSYGRPASTQNGANGIDLWDYGSFRVIFQNDTVSYAAMW